MQNPFTIKSFNNEEDYFEFLILLKSNNINFETEVLNSMIDPVRMRPIDKEFHINIEKKDISKVEEILNNEALKAIEYVDKTHYLFDFSSKELYEIIENKDEWSPFDYHLAKKILLEREENIDENYLNSVELERMEKQYQQEKVPSGLIYTGFIFSLLGGPVGIAIGFYIFTSKKVLRTGDSFFAFPENERKKAAWMMGIGAVVFLLVWYKLINEMLV